MGLRPAKPTEDNSSTKISDSIPFSRYFGTKRLSQKDLEIPDLQVFKAALEVNWEYYLFVNMFPSGDAHTRLLARNWADCRSEWIRENPKETELPVLCSLESDPVFKLVRSV